MWFQSIDDKLFPMLNGSDNLFLDGLMCNFTSGYTWIPLFLSLIYLIIKNNETMRQILMIIFFALIAVVLAGGIDDFIIKPMVMRLRPLNEPALGVSVDTIRGMTARSFSFFSAHSANTFAIAMFVTLLVRSKILGIFMFSWAALNALTRTYLGLHYPTDLIAGMIWGCIMGAIAYFSYDRLFYKHSPRINYISSQYTSSGYNYGDIDFVVAVLVFTVAAVSVSVPMFFI